MNVGFIGLGLMGRPMALNLLKAGHAVQVWTRRLESRTPLVEAGARSVSSCAALGANCDVVISMVADGPDVEQVMLGEEGVRAGALASGRTDLVAVDMSTINPNIAIHIAQQLAACGVDFLDAPVSGGDVGAKAGTLTILVGGSEAGFTRVLPVFQAMGKTVTHMGPSGAGQVTKACNQTIVAATKLAIAESFLLARRYGVDPAKVRQALMGGFAGSRIMEIHGERMIEGQFEPGFKSWMLQKDLNIVQQMAQSKNVAVPGAALSTQLFNAMTGSGRGEMDTSAIIELLGDLSGPNR